MATIGLFINEHKPAARRAAERLTDAMRGRDVTLLARDVVASTLPPDECCAAPDEDIAKADFVVVLGGDGTILSAARMVAPYGTPLLGVHLGTFGFITEAAPEDLLQVVDDALEGRAKIEERLMLTGLIERNGADRDAPPETLLAMNDLVIASQSVRMVHVETRIGDTPLATYAADGVIVASPTGSTGYSLSAGGPLVHPSAPVMIVTPICPHTLNARTLIVPDTETVHLTIHGQARDQAVVSVDGQREVPVNPGDVVTVFCAPHRVKFLTVGGPNFYEKIRSRWHYGQRQGG